MSTTTATATQLEAASSPASLDSASGGSSPERSSGDRRNVPVPDELAAVRAEIKRLKDRDRELCSMLIANPDLREGASWLAEIKEVTQKRVDLDELRYFHPETVAEFTHPQTTTQVRLSGVTEDGEVIPARTFRKLEASQQ